MRVKVFVGLMLLGFVLAMAPHVFADNATTDKVNKTLDFLGEKGSQYITGLEELTKEYAPQAVDAGFMVIKLHGYQNLVFGGFLVVFLWIPIVWVWKITATDVKEETDPYGIPDGAIAARVVVSIIGISGMLIGGGKLLNLWNWVAIIEPKLWIAHRVFEKLL